MHIHLKTSRFITLKYLAIFLFAAFTIGCSNIGIKNPFGGKKVAATGPANATEYICEGNKHFYLRMLNSGSDAWLIYPDHEVNLTKSATNNTRYTSGAISLELNGDSTTLNDGEKIAYTACKPQVKK